MNAKRLLPAILAVFAGVWITDFIIHGVWLSATYKATKELWRPEAEMQAHLGWLMAGEFLAAATFTVLYAKGFADKGCIVCACLYGMFMGMFSQANTFITYAVQPIPLSLAVKWFVSGMAQGVVLGVLVFFVYKPATGDRLQKGSVSGGANG